MASVTLKGEIVNKEKFLEDPNVVGFIDRMTDVINGDVRIIGSYYHTQAKKDFEFDCLSDAFNNYYYKAHSLEGFIITGFSEHKNVLDTLKERLRMASDEVSAKDSAIALMKWGGTCQGNCDVIEEMARSKMLLEYISSAKVYFGNDNPEQKLFNKFQIRSNAGFTKIHSLIMDDFIIYDSRVAAALGMFIVKYCYDKNLASIPDDLSLCWLQGIRGKQLRNPSFPPRYIFPTFNPGSRKSENDKLRYYAQHCMHAESNCKANWILVKALEKSRGFAGVKGQDALRAIEAALFTVGYDLSKTYGILAGHNLPTPSVALKYSI